MTPDEAARQLLTSAAACDLMQATHDPFSAEGECNVMF